MQTTSLGVDLAERVAVLESEWTTAKNDLVDIKSKLDELLHLKSQGMGALWLVSIIISSGIVGVVAAVLNFLNKPHL